MNQIGLPLFAWIGEGVWDFNTVFTLLSVLLGLILIGIVLQLRQKNKNKEEGGAKATPSNDGEYQESASNTTSNTCNQSDIAGSKTQKKPAPFTGLASLYFLSMRIPGAKSVLHSNL